MKKVLAIMGSPRKGKNTDILLDKLLEGIDKQKYEIEKIYLGDMHISPCTSCYYCAKTGKCCINDSMQGLYKALDESDVTIVASPLYFNSISGITKIMIDRCQMFWSSKYEYGIPSIDRNKKRKGIFLGIGGSPYREGQFDACIPIIDIFFKSVNTQYCHNLLCSNTDEIPVCQREDVMEQAYEIGKQC